MSAPGESTSRFVDDPYDGPSKIVIGIGIGPKHCGIAFTFLIPGAKRSIQRVTRRIGQQSESLHGKIPTVLWYDSVNRAVSFGAEASTPQAQADAEDGGWKLAQYFTFHLHPPHLITQRGLQLEPLPPGVPLSQIYSDFLGYLFQCTQSYFEERVVNGKRAWRQYCSTMEVVLAHPNGWGNREQAFLRLAVVKAGFTSATDAAKRVHFVSEAAAAAYSYTLYSGIDSQLRPGAMFAVCDAGRLTVVTTVYTVKGTNPICLEETRASTCVKAGGIYVDRSAESYLRQIFTKAGIPQEDIDKCATRGIEDFEQNSKRAFKDVTTDQSIEIAGTRYHNKAIRARRGRITLEGSVVKTFFDSCVNRIVESVHSQSQGDPVSYILLVGGFGQSPFLRDQLKLRLDPIGCAHLRTPGAVTEGAIVWHWLHRVR